MDTSRLVSYICVHYDECDKCPFETMVDYYDDFIKCPYSTGQTDCLFETHVFINEALRLGFHPIDHDYKED